MIPDQHLPIHKKGHITCKSIGFKGTIMQIEKALINDRLS